MLKPIIISFSMYSRIPVPTIEWDEKSMKYAICFFPIVGAVIGLVMYLTFLFFRKIEAGNTLRGCILAVIPLIITGGIHMDGFIDTSDALSSNQNIQKRLDIMKDPHVGAFAVIKAAVYIVLSVGLYSEVSTINIVCLGFILSRALIGIAVIAFPKAKDTGLAAMWSGLTDRKNALAILIGEAVACSAAMLCLDLYTAIITLVFSGAVFYSHYRNCIKNFGGITGDLAGYFLQLEELAVLASAVVGGKLWY